MVDAPPHLVLGSAGEGPVDGARLRAALEAAGMDASGAEWRIEGADARAGDQAFAIEMRAEDTRSLARLASDVRMARLGGEPAIVLAVPDRGDLTRRLVLPVVRARLAEFAREIGAEVVLRRRRSGDGFLQLQWVLDRHPRGRAAPDAQPHRLEAPRLPSGGRAARGTG